MGADAICIKDMANLLLPYEAYSLVKKLKEDRQAADSPAHPQHHRYRRHDDHAQGHRSGRGHRGYLRCRPLASGTSQPATESLVATLKGTEYDTGLDLELLNEMRDALPRRGRRVWRRTAGSIRQGAARGRQHPEVSGAGRHAVQPDWSAEAGRTRWTSTTTCWLRVPQCS